MAELPVAIVVVNLDGGAMLDACLDSLAGQGACAVVVVDNGSGPDELARLAARAEVSLVRLPENRGFAGPANRGVEEVARGAAPPYVAVLNNDCTLEPGYLRACVKALEEDAGLAAAQGVVLDGEGTRVDGLGIGWNGRAEAVQLGLGEAPPPADGFPFSVPGVSATAAVYRLEAFRKAGGFEESFFAYYEDADLSLRLARAGWRFACVPAARARHLGSATGRRTPHLMWRRLFTNRTRTLRRNLSPAATNRALLFGTATGSALRAAAREIGWLRASWTALLSTYEPAAVRRRDLEVFAAQPPLAKLPA